MRIVLFLTCFNDTMFPDTGRAVVHVLERLGHTVGFPQEQTCRGQMHFDTGYRPEAVPLVERFTRTFAAYDSVVTPSASCAGMTRDSHPVPARNHGSAALQEEVAGLAPRVHEFPGSLTDVLGVTDVEARFPHRVAYRPRLVRPPAATSPRRPRSLSASSGARTANTTSTRRREEGGKR
ncbi:heterodisulfide reductase-related iron-sulfur binding cluster [Streptomyces griseoflavus]|uniref:heterodisulfide reductase-related iron-sulfur binding cluster n=1 Tax=Streptomyces griseoflavus TaxID=35619 RepID=UPI003D719F6A